MTFDDFAEHLTADGALLALDVGTKTIGLAASDVTRRVATPVGVIRRRKLAADIAALQKTIESRKPLALIVGLPLNMDGSEGPRVQSVRAFVRNISPHVSLPMFFWDERLSTVSAERVMVEADLSRAKRAEKIDAAAAAVILQAALDRLAALKRG